MHKNKTSFKETLEMVQKLKPDVLPNAGFATQLLEFEEELALKNSTNTVLLDAM
jgi:hypothetical protein